MTEKTEPAAIGQGAAGRNAPLHGAGAEPASFPRRVFLGTLGLFPQVVTETLWCLARRTPAFVPSEIHLVTTLEGRRRAELTLLDPSTAVLRALAEDLGHPGLADALTPDRLHVASGPDGHPLTDIDSAEDNEAVADTITRLVAQFTADPETALHVSIAGGRKTMGFLAGYAVSLYGREQDRLSHVLVSAPLESHPQFFFPPKRPRVLIAQGSNPVSTAEARLTLADIPFVRLRAALRPDIVAANPSYSELVEAMQAQFSPPHLVVDVVNSRLVADGKEIRLPPLALTFAVIFAHFADREEGIGWLDLDWDWVNRVDTAIRRLHVGSTVARSRKAWLANDESRQELFHQQVSKLRSHMRQALGVAANKYLPVTIRRRPNARIRFACAPEAIEIVGLPEV